MINGKKVVILLSCLWILVLILLANILYIKGWFNKILIYITN